MSAPTLVWDSSIQRYRSLSTGRIISPATVRSALDDALQVAAQRNKSLVDDLRAGRVSLDEFRLGMRQSIKDVNLYSAATARGGWAQMDQPAYGRTGQMIREDYQYLEQWTQDIANGAPLDGRANSRAALYAQSGRGTFHLVQAEEMVKSGIDEEQNVLHPAEHCDDCQAASDQGWVPLGTLPAIGTRQCLANCKCTIQYRRSA